MTGLEHIKQERLHQLRDKQHTVAKDVKRYGDRDSNSCLVDAAITFLKHGIDTRGTMQLYPLWALISAQKTTEVPDSTPRQQRIHRLRIAGALIAAEIDRLQATDAAAV
jgi:hypothetical protein